MTHVTHSPALISLNQLSFQFANGDTLFRFYLTAGDTDVVMDQNDQFKLQLLGDDLSSSSNVHIINSDEYVRPHNNYQGDYATDFDSATAGNGADRDWLSSDTDGGEFAVSGPITVAGQTLDAQGGMPRAGSTKVGKGESPSPFCFLDPEELRACLTSKT